MSNYRIYVEKKENFQTEALSLKSDLESNLNLIINEFRLINIYDVFNISNELLKEAKTKVFAEINTDNVFDSIDLTNYKYFAVEYLPGQFDQRAESAKECIALIKEEDIEITSGKLLLFDKNIKEEDINKIKKYYINEIESREKNLEILNIQKNQKNSEVIIEEDFNNLSKDEIINFHYKHSLAMSINDLLHIQNYFKNEEKRNPNYTEIKLLDTYWSDHCRHTTFETKLTNMEFPDDEIGRIIENTFKEYLSMRKSLKRENKDVTLMDMATINARYEFKNGNLKDLEQSEENNACSIIINVDINGKEQKYLLMFKNETHNHPTEIEPFGGASTCIGGAIRDPLSGRGYVYQALRISGAADITEDISETIPGKLPQKVISKQAANGYSSYGNQIGLATTFVKEIYHEGFKAKRLELGAVVAAVKKSNVIRKTPKAGDVIILLGGRTGRDGVGGATGSSKEHTEESLEISFSEVQKGNAPEERKIQRLFRNPKVIKMIKKSNDFGAGGVSVAIGEISDGVDIYLDRIKTKYQGLNITELALSESQERMAVVVDKENEEIFKKYCFEENLEATTIAYVTDKNRLVMYYNNKKVVDINRDFINTNGVRNSNDVSINKVDLSLFPENIISGNSLEEKIINNLTKLNTSSQKGLIEMFDSSIGGTTVLMPLGGKTRLKEEVASVQKIPIIDGTTNTCSIMSYGYNPDVSKWSPFHGSIYSVVESLSKIVSVGGDYRKVRFSFQEYFPKLNKDKNRWGLPTASLLGSIKVLKELKLASIGGKDSMSGSFKDLDVPPTLVSFAVSYDKSDNIIDSSFKELDNYIYLMELKYDKNLLPNINDLKNNYDFLIDCIKNKKVISANPLLFGGLSEALIKSSFGNLIGFNVNTNFDLFKLSYGSILIESKEELKHENLLFIGKTSSDYIINNVNLDLNKLIDVNLKKFKKIFPVYSNKNNDLDLSIIKKGINKTNIEPYGKKVSKVKVLIPVFLGTNCEYDMYKIFKQNGATPEFFVFNSLNQSEIIKSIDEFSKKIEKTHILVFSGGFSLGDEPDGSGKYIANIINNKKVKKAINKLLSKKGLIIGICNGFQALIKSGLLPFNQELHEDSPTLFKNDINRHISVISKTIVNSVNSPWLKSFNIGDVHDIPLSHGEGKFYINEKQAKELFENNQVAFMYVDNDNNPTMDPKFNPNGSYYAIEGIISKCGRILGKMGHSERFDSNLYKNIEGKFNQNIFKNAVDYFKGE